MYTITSRTTTKGVSRFTCQVRVRTKDEDVSVAQTLARASWQKHRAKKREHEFGKTVAVQWAKASPSYRRTKRQRYRPFS